MRRSLPLALMALAGLPLQASDLTLTHTYESTGPTGRVMKNSSTLLIHDQRSHAPAQSYVGDMQGNKTYGTQFAFIRQCDLKQIITVDLDNQIYSVHQLPKGMTRQEYEADVAKAKAQPKPQLTETLTITTDVVDTGETKPIFGRTAHHYKIHRKQEPSAGANANAREDFTDGWYIDIPEYQQLRGCDPFAEFEKPGTRRTVSFLTSGSRPINYRIVLKTSSPQATNPTMVGNVAADIVTTTHEWMKNPDGSVHEFTNTNREKITALSTGPLDPSLFDVPHGYARVSEVKTSSNPTWTYRAEIAWAKFWNSFGL